MIVVDLLVAMGYSDVSTLASHLFETGGLMDAFQVWKSWEVVRKGDIPNSKSCFASNQKTIRSHLKSLGNKFQFFQQFGGSCPGNLSRLSGMHEDFRKIWQLHPVSTYDFWLTRIQCYQLHFCCLVPGWVVACWLGWLVATIPMSSGDETSNFCFFPEKPNEYIPLSNRMLGRWFMIHIFCWKGPNVQVTFVHFAGEDSRLLWESPRLETWETFSTNP